jgi:hypothetical protein
MATYDKSSLRKRELKIRTRLDGRPVYYKVWIDVFRIDGAGTFHHANTDQELTQGFWWDEWTGSDENPVHGPFRSRKAAIDDAQRFKNEEAGA